MDKSEVVVHFIMALFLAATLSLLILAAVGKI